MVTIPKIQRWRVKYRWLPCPGSHRKLKSWDSICISYCHTNSELTTHAWKQQSFILPSLGVRWVAAGLSCVALKVLAELTHATESTGVSKCSLDLSGQLCFSCVLCPARTWELTRACSSQRTGRSRRGLLRLDSESAHWYFHVIQAWRQEAECVVGTLWGELHSQTTKIQWEVRNQCQCHHVPQKLYNSLGIFHLKLGTF
jgi:hypothetical protein